MATQPATRTYNLSVNWLLRLVALLCFIAALCVSETWLTKGTWQEWISGGLIAYTLSTLA